MSDASKRTSPSTDTLTFPYHMLSQGNTLSNQMNNTKLQINANVLYVRCFDTALYIYGHISILTVVDVVEGIATINV